MLEDKEFIFNVASALYEESNVGNIKSSKNHSVLLSFKVLTPGNFDDVTGSKESRSERVIFNVSK